MLAFVSCSHLFWQAGLFWCNVGQVAGGAFRRWALPPAACWPTRPKQMAYGYVRGNPLRWNDPLGLLTDVCNAEWEENNISNNINIPEKAISAIFGQTEFYQN